MPCHGSVRALVVWTYSKVGCFEGAHARSKNSRVVMEDIGDDQHCSRSCIDVAVQHNRSSIIIVVNSIALFLLHLSRVRKQLRSRPDCATAVWYMACTAVGPGVVERTEASPELSICATSHADAAIESLREASLCQCAQASCRAHSYSCLHLRLRSIKHRIHRYPHIPS